MVNLSPVQFRSEQLPLRVAQALAMSGLSPQRLELEITETCCCAIPKRCWHAQEHQVARHPTGARRLRHRLFVAQLPAEIPFDRIKIDQKFIAFAGAGRRKPGHRARDHRPRPNARQKPVTAEGVETEQQSNYCAPKDATPCRDTISAGRSRPTGCARCSNRRSAASKASELTRSAHPATSVSSPARSRRYRSSAGRTV